MAEDLMQTQTGGEGETIQSAPVAENNPEQFDVKLPQANQTEPPIANEPPVQATAPVEPPPMQQQSMIDNQQIAEDIQTQVDSEPVEEEMPIDENVGYLDWYSGNKINKIIDNDIAKSMAQQKEEVVTPDDVQPQQSVDRFAAVEDDDILFINGAPVESTVDKELVDANPSDAVDDESEDVILDEEIESINGVPVERRPTFEGVGKLPIMPLGVESDDFLELRNKYKDYDLETDIFGNVKATKKVEEKPAIKKGKTEVDKPVKEKATIKEGQVLSYEFNKDFDYKIEDGFWRRKKKDSNTWQTLTNEGSINALNKYFKTNIPTVKIYKGKPGYDYAIIDNQWNIRKKGDSNWMVINNAGRIEALNKMHKKNISVPQTGVEKKLTQAANITGQAGFGLGTTPMETISTDKTGRAITEGTNRSLLFSSNAPIYQSSASIQASAQERSAEIERQRQVQLASAKTEAQRQKINQDFDKELAQSKERQKVEEKTAAGVSKGIAEDVSVPKPPVVKKKVDILKEFNVLAPDDVLSTNINIVEQKIMQPLSAVKLAKEQQAEEYVDRAYNDAKNFIDKDLDAWRKTTGIALTDAQFKDYKDYQNKLKSFLKDKEDLSPQGALFLRKQMEKVDKQFEYTVENNKEINRAADMGQSLSEYQLDQKRKLISKLTSSEELAGKNEVLGRAKELFNTTAAIHDFVNDYIKDGSVYVDANGNYKVNSKLPAYKKEFIENKLGGLIQKYEAVKKTSYNTFQEDIDKLRYEKRLLVSYVSQQQDIADDKSKSPEERRMAALKVKEANRKIYGLNNEINDLRTNSGSLLSTDPELLMMSISGVAKASDLEAIFKATDKNLTPKQRFDVMYSRLTEENEKLARAYNIDTNRLDKIGARFRSLLDWESTGVKLTPQEKKYFANQKVLNALLPAYLNNEIGITEGSASFSDSFQNSLTSFFIGEDMAAAQGDFNQTAMVREALNKLKSMGFEEKDFGSPIKLKELEKRQNVDWVSAEGAGEILAPTVGIIIEMLATKKVSLGALNKLKGLANLTSTIGKTKGAVGYGDKVEKVYKAYENSMKSSKLGNAMFGAVEQGAMFEATGELFGASEDDMGFLQGAAGSLAGQLIGGVFSKLTPKKSAEILNKVFGANSEKAVNVLKKAANISTTATGETAEEFGEELASIYQSTLEGNGFFEELENRFGTFDKVMKFVVSSYVLGAGMGIAMGTNKKADELKEAMNPEDRQRVEDALTAVRETLQNATGEMNVAAETAAEEIKAEQIAKGEAIPDGKAETEREDSAITFDVDGIIKNDQEIEQKKTAATETGTKVVGEEIVEDEPVTESSFKEPIDLTDDKKDETGIPSEERKGEEPIETEPVAEAGKEEVSPGGVLQEKEQIEVEPSKAYSFEYDSEEDIPEELRGVEPQGRTEVQFGKNRFSKKKKKIRLTFGGRQLIEAGLAKEAKVESEEEQITLSPEQKEAYDKLSLSERESIDELINDEKYERSIKAKDVDNGDLEDEINKSAISFEDALNKALNISKPKIKVSETNEVFAFGDKKYDIDKANNVIQNESLKAVDVPVEVLPKMSYSFISIDEETVKNADINKPVIIAKTKDGLLLIDGHHRVRKAIDENKPIKAFVLSEEQTNQVTVGKPERVSKRKRKEAKPEVAKTEKELNKEFDSLNKQYIKDSKLLDEKTAKNEDTTDIEERLNATQEKMSAVSSELEKVSAKAEPVETKTEIVSLSKKDQEEIKFLDDQIRSTEMRIEDLQWEIETERGNLKEEKERIKQEKSKVRSSKMSRDEKQERLEELDSELEDIIDDHDDLVQGYKDDIAQEKSDLRRYNRDKNKITERVETKPQAEPTADVDTQFDEASKISKMPVRSPKRKTAIADFDAKHGEGSYNRISKIDSNFGDIVKKLEDKKVITKEC